MMIFDCLFNRRRYFVRNAAVSILSGLLTPADFSQTNRSTEQIIKQAIEYAEALYDALHAGNKTSKK